MTYPTIEQQESLVKRKLAIRKQHEDLPLVLYKYHRNVVFDDLWSKYPELMECRGHVYDTETGELVQSAPRKCFNYDENGWWSDVTLDTKVRIEKKYNGFLACATMYKGELLVTTTGSFNSEFQQLAKKMILENAHKSSNVLNNEKLTYHFEICHPSDPHIVAEDENVYELASRDKTIGNTIPYTTELHDVLKLSEILDLVKTKYDIEGFMMYAEGKEICKLKTPIYIAKKKLMRITARAMEKFYNCDKQQFKNTIDPQFHFLVDFVADTPEIIKKWSDLTEQDRRGILDLRLLLGGYEIA